MTLPQTQTMTVNYIFLLNILCNTTINTAVTSAQIEVMKIFFVSPSISIHNFTLK